MTSLVILAVSCVALMALITGILKYVVNMGESWIKENSENGLDD